MVDYSTNKTTPPKFKRLEQLTLPTLSTKGGTTVYIYILEPFARKTDVDKNGVIKMGEDNNPKTITIATVANLIDGAQYQMVVGSVLESELLHKYPNNTYVAHAFEVYIPNDMQAGKKYKVPKIITLEIPDNIDDILGSLLPPRKHADLVAAYAPKPASKSK